MRAKTIAKVILGIVLSLLLIGAGAFCFLLTQPKFIASTTIKLINQKSSDLVIKELTIDSLRWASWNQVIFKNVRIKCKLNGASYFLSAGELAVEHVNGVITEEPMLVSVKNMAVVSDHINASDILMDVEVYFERLRFKEAQGDFYGPMIEFDQYALNRSKTRFKIDNSQMELEDIQAEFYRGSIKGDITIDYKPKVYYNASLHFDQIDLKSLSQANPSVFEHMKGRFAGDIRIKGSPHLIRELKITINSNQGDISSKILNILAQVLPKGNIFRQPLDQIIQTQNSVHFETGNLSIESTGLEKYQAKVNILSSKAAIDLRYTYDINIQGGLLEILDFLKVFKQQ